MEDFTALTGALVAVACVLFLTWWCSRLLGRSWGRAASGGNMRVLERLQVGADRQLLLVKVQEHCFLLGVSSAGIELLTEIEGELKENTQPAGILAEHAFGDVLKKYAFSHKQKKEEEDE